MTYDRVVFVLVLILVAALVGLGMWGLIRAGHPVLAILFLILAASSVSFQYKDDGKNDMRIGGIEIDRGDKCP